MGKGSRQSNRAPTTAEVIQQRLAAFQERSKPLSTVRAAARLEIEQTIAMMGQIARGELTETLVVDGKASTSRMNIDAKTRIQAFRALTIIGVPSAIEERDWDGDWSQFTPDEIERIIQGEHPEDLLAFRAVQSTLEPEPEEDFTGEDVP